MSLSSAVSLPEGQSDYECFVSDIRNDFEMRVETVQKTAEENTRAYESYCGELKSQLQESQSSRQHLEDQCAHLRLQLEQSKAERNKLETQLSDLNAFKTKNDSCVTDLLRNMTCLSVRRVSSQSDEDLVYMCTVDDGLIKGHQFSLSLDKSNWEYTYKPLSSIAISTGFNMNSTMCFPDYMISRFLSNILQTTYS